MGPPQNTAHTNKQNHTAFKLISFFSFRPPTPQPVAVGSGFHFRMDPEYEHRLLRQINIQNDNLSPVVSRVFSVLLNNVNVVHQH